MNVTAITVEPGNFSSASPYLGEVKRGHEIGKTPGRRFFVWASCNNCGEERWVTYPEHPHLCRACRNKISGKILSTKYRGEGSPSYKTGRYETKQGYIKVILTPGNPYYPMAESKHYIPEHRLVMAKKLGRFLLKSEIVHHIDGNRSNNSEKNLVLMSRASHDTYNKLCKDCPLRTEIRLLRLQSKIMLEQIRELHLLLMGDR